MSAVTVISIILAILGIFGIIFIPIFLIILLFYKLKTRKWKRKIPEKVKKEVENVRKKKEREIDSERTRYIRDSDDRLGEREITETTEQDRAGDRDLQTAGTFKEQRSVQVQQINGTKRDKQTFKIHKPDFI